MPWNEGVTGLPGRPQRPTEPASGAAIAHWPSVLCRILGVGPPDRLCHQPIPEVEAGRGMVAFRGSWGSWGVALSLGKVT